MARGPGPTLAMAAVRPGSICRKPPGPVRVVRVDNEHAPAVAGLDVGRCETQIVFEPGEPISAEVSSEWR